jgi:uncharacterized membrane protein
VEPVAARVRLPLGLFLMGVGTIHFLMPKFFDRIVPHVLGHERLFTYASGLAEIATGALVANPRTTRVGGRIAAVLFVAVFPANVQHTVDHWPPRDAEGWGSLVRLPMQVPLVLWGLWVAKGPRRAPSTRGPSPR